jgi:hypothetical protein
VPGDVEERTEGPRDTVKPDAAQRGAAGKRRRWLLGLEPIFEGGLKGKRAQAWDVEDELIAVALLGDVTIDLSQNKSAPAEINIEAYAIIRDVDVLAAEDTHVEMFGGVLRGNLENEVPPVPEERRDRVIRIHGHCMAGDVRARLADGHQPASLDLGDEDQASST